MNHIVLLGDSVFDNATYVKGGPDVIRQLQAKLPDGWSATLCAIDGSMVQHVKSQLSRLPHDPTHLVVSAGGTMLWTTSTSSAKRLSQRPKCWIV
jgi:hypothetical protein